jgi:haloacetate dehalogenase
MRPSASVVQPFRTGRRRSAHHSFAPNHPEALEKASVLDIAPTLTMYNDTNKEFATKYLWWFLQIQPSPMPEHLISLEPVYYLRDHLAVQGKTSGAVTRL